MSTFTHWVAGSMRRVSVHYNGVCLGLGVSIYRHPRGTVTAGEFRTEVSIEFLCWTAYIGLRRRVPERRNEPCPACEPPRGEVTG
jgi:hypothetical protein